MLCYAPLLLNNNNDKQNHKKNYPVKLVNLFIYKLGGDCIWPSCFFLSFERNKNFNEKII